MGAFIRKFFRALVKYTAYFMAGVVILLAIAVGTQLKPPRVVA